MTKRSSNHQQQPNQLPYPPTTHNEQYQIERLPPPPHHDRAAPSRNTSSRFRVSKYFTYISPIIKWLMFGFNFFFWVVGCVLVGVGVWAHVVKGEGESSSGDGGTSDEINMLFEILLTPSILVITLGVIVFVLGFCGCLGALRENTLLLKIFAWSLLIIFILECVLGILGFAMSGTIKPKLREVIREEVFMRYFDPEHADLQNLVDFVQEEFECCGVSEQGYLDWSNNRYFNCSPQAKRQVWSCGVPFSCCKDPYDVDSGLVNTACGQEAQLEVYPSDRINVSGCLDAVSNAIRNNIFTIAGIIIGTAIPQLVGIYLSRTLISQIEDQRALWNYQ